eukprot:CAMPEP_0197416190 /NCGR_PEP_ID=MMETSP1170-20131217/2553_1 /TAXON_ID=54406 /ORGANISM="Sarcinochrysis sp, Strain CCMP770" /LENGTH=41 /DNA_ID= /DNA_START= /DNA_END= /DNA_ORIENTATION=
MDRGARDRGPEEAKEISVESEHVDAHDEAADGDLTVAFSPP